MASNELWTRALRGDQVLLQRLVNEEVPPEVVQQLSVHIVRLHTLATLHPEQFPLDVTRAFIEQLGAAVEVLRGRMGWIERRVSDLDFLRALRHLGWLALVLGAGATVAAGGPSWPSLVQRLLEVALEQGRRDYEYDRTGNAQSWEVRARLVNRVRFGPAEQAEAEEILQRVRGGETDTEVLMQGAQLCADLFGTTLFQQVTIRLYAQAQRPSDIHRAIARLARPLQVPGQADPWPGWTTVVNYNFDSLLNDAFEEEGVNYAVELMRRGVVERIARRQQSPANPPVSVMHLHGFTPRQPFFDIAGIDYVFSTAQYARVYAGRDSLVDRVRDRCIAAPGGVALYVGCSLSDEAMNDMIAESAQRFPQKFHYALLERPKGIDELDEPGYARAAETYERRGIRPIWFSAFSEIPDLIMRLA